MLQQAIGLSIILGFLSTELLGIFTGGLGFSGISGILLGTALPHPIHSAAFAGGLWTDALDRASGYPVW